MEHQNWLWWIPALPLLGSVIAAVLHFLTLKARKADPDAAAAVALTFGKGLERDRDASRDFWKRYDTRLGDAALRVNDAYLKAQGQERGIHSYDLMVDLLVADHRRESY